MSSKFKKVSQSNNVSPRDPLAEGSTNLLKQSPRVVEGSVLSPTVHLLEKGKKKMSLHQTRIQLLNESMLLT